MRLHLTHCLLPLAAFVTTPALAAPCTGQWVAAWTSAQMVPTGDNALAPGMLADATLRQIVRPSVAGSQVRVRLSNLAGTSALHVEGASLARALRPGAAAVDGRTIVPLRFDGHADVVIPAGADYLSDPVVLPVKAFDDLAVSIRYGEEPSVQTSHPGSRATSWLLKGDHLADAGMAGAQPVEHWFSLAALEVERCTLTQVIVALGDSITDGRGATTDGNDRWTDNLARRLQADPKRRHMAIVNQGIGGNRLLQDGLGPNALARLDRDVLAQPGVRALILLEGINDIGTLTREAPASAADHAELVKRMTGAYRQIIARARSRGIKVIGGTILPFAGNGYYHPDAANEADRQVVNQWIRTPGHFDAVIDFDRALRDPAWPDRLLSRYDSGDGLHPSPAGYRAMADAIPLGLFP
ncbi:GDSL family lipase [Sphingobium sp. LB126]|uniref:SGNH/GDSL hydrolase family protein n=1 Tax=Sphingobium sp. LB126 TaxID=1983755 RepID=UPI000C20B651|nr:SGNH/GDSL hydrolase family protein [Sphingobium sp. LB126]PJG45972.1 GDSL family lipase [Sphingobium sp. LB126]